MPEFSAHSLEKLKTCHIDLQTLFLEVIKYRDCTILEGHRNEEDQNKAFDAGKSKLRWPNGNHNATPSNAVDVAPYPLPDWKCQSDFDYFAGYVIGMAKGLYLQERISHAIRWGGDWKMTDYPSENSFNDLVHFELYKP